MDQSTTTTSTLTRLLLSTLVPALIMLVFLATATGLKFGIERQEDSQIQASLATEAAALTRGLEQEFLAHVQALRRMAERTAAAPDTSEAVWRHDARNYLTDYGVYQAIEWIDRDFIVRWVEPIDGNQDVVGYNVAFSDSRLSALIAARETGRLDVSGVIELKQGGSGLVIYVPILAGADNRGFIAGVFRMENLARAILTERVLALFRVDIFQGGEPAYQLNADLPVAAEFRHLTRVELPRIKWTLAITPSESWVADKRSIWPWLTFSALVVMGLLTSLSTLLVQLILKRNRALLKTRHELERQVSEREAVQQDLARLASTDALTGLANRRFFMEDLAHTLKTAWRQQRQVALVMIDLDRFQTLNDSLGHQFGDDLLVLVAERLNLLSDERVMIAYSGGDEFMICQQHVDDLDEVIHLLGQIKQCFAEPFLVHGEHHSITATMGVAIYPQSGVDADVLLRNADIALYRAKESGRNTYQFYTEGMQDREVLRLELDKDLSKALADNEFVLHYQPQLELARGRMESVEALIRWQHPQRGLLPPGEFIPLAEESGRIGEIGRWVVLAACRQLADWAGTPLGQLRVAVNLSGRELDDEHLVDHIQRALALSGVAPDRLEIELTEEIFIQNIERNLRQLSRLHQLGVHLSIDDFGVGYSSLAYLRDFPVDLLKIDRSFVRNMTERQDDAVITRAVISLAHSLGIRVVAEGVETEAQLALLRRQACDLIQGYLVSRPVPAEELPEVLARGFALDDLSVDR